MDDQQRVELTLLGGWDLRVDGTSCPMGLRQQRLIAALAVLGRRSRGCLAGLLWPECTEAHAMGSLRAAVFTVSRRLPGLLASSGRELCLAGTVEVDLHRLRRALVGATAGDPVTDPWWSAGAAGAELLPGWYDDWVVTEQRRLRDLCLTAAECLAESALGRQDHFRARHLAETARSIDPLSEGATRILLQAHLAMGNEATALGIFRAYCATLADELGARPAPRMVELLAPVQAARGPERPLTARVGARPPR